ncbi:MAG: beta-Ala-His dipeptidase [Solobacterium sp.]|nr:beta-Ala-His dipeptidase [Solobacterium sp.]
MDFDLNKRYCYYFRQISDIPRGSYHEKAVSDYIVSWAKELGLAVKQDHVWNVIVEKPASPGREDAEPVILQAHLDMVCEKNKGVEHDFMKDPLDLYVDENGWLHARGTTLGADDGMGVAYIMAVLEDDGLVHPPIQALFTVQEEVGLLGAMELKAEDIHAKRLISLDGGGVNETAVSSAGGGTFIVSKKIDTEENHDPAYALGIRGLKGGHSGLMIHLERGNSNKLIARVLKELQLAGADIRLVNISGGLKNNAIPREADAVFTSADEPAFLEKIIRTSEQNIQAELEFSDEGFHVLFEKTGGVPEHFTQEVSDDIINYMYLVPDGFRHRSMVIDGLTVNSLNLGVVTTENGKTVLDISVRSALETYTDDLEDQLRTLAEYLRMDVVCLEHHPSWPYAKESGLRRVYAEVLERYDMELVEVAAHGGLEAGVFCGFVPGMDIITMGADTENVHTPDETMDLASFDRAYGLLCEILAELH